MVAAEDILERARRSVAADVPDARARLPQGSWEPSSSVLVWLASYLGPLAGAARLYGTDVQLVSHAGARSTGAVCIATFAAGPVVFEVFYAGNTPGLPDAYALEERPAITVIWPFREPCNWEDREGFDDAGLDDFALALRSAMTSALRQRRRAPLHRAPASRVDGSQTPSRRLRPPASAGTGACPMLDAWGAAV